MRPGAGRGEGVTAEKDGRRVGLLATDRAAQGGDAAGDRPRGGPPLRGPGRRGHHRRRDRGGGRDLPAHPVAVLLLQGGVRRPTADHGPGRGRRTARLLAARAHPDRRHQHAPARPFGRRPRRGRAGAARPGPPGPHRTGAARGLAPGPPRGRTGPRPRPRGPHRPLPGRPGTPRPGRPAQHRPPRGRRGVGLAHRPGHRHPGRGHHRGTGDRGGGAAALRAGLSD